MLRCVWILTALSVAAAWPIFFYDNALVSQAFRRLRASSCYLTFDRCQCNHYPVFTLEGPPHPNTCNLFGSVDIWSYSGGTGDNVESEALQPGVDFSD